MDEAVNQNNKLLERVENLETIINKGFKDLTQVVNKDKLSAVQLATQVHEVYTVVKNKSSKNESSDALSLETLIANYQLNSPFAMLLDFKVFEETLQDQNSPIASDLLFLLFI